MGSGFADALLEFGGEGLVVVLVDEGRRLHTRFAAQPLPEFIARGNGVAAFAPDRHPFFRPSVENSERLAEEVGDCLPSFQLEFGLALHEWVRCDCGFPWRALRWAGGARELYSGSGAVVRNVPAEAVTSHHRPAYAIIQQVVQRAPKRR